MNLFPDIARFRRTLTLLVTLTLAGCTQSAVSGDLTSAARLTPPEVTLPDYLSTDCQAIWALSGHQVEANPLYWLRGMDCAGRLQPAQARAEARRWPAVNWQNTFRQGILLSNARISPPERRQYVEKLDSLASEIPSQIRPLFQVWRNGQVSLLQLSDERSRYVKLQQTTDSQLDILREQQTRLRNQLDLTTRKLESLTDIERQLSSRKVIPDTSHPATEPGITGSEVNPDKTKTENPPAQEAEKP